MKSSVTKENVELYEEERVMLNFNKQLIKHTMKVVALFLSFFILIFQQVNAQHNSGSVRKKANADKKNTISSKNKNTNHITPNDFKGTDTERIQAAINAAKETTHSIVIPRRNSNGTNIWKIDSAILLPGNMVVILDNCILQLSDSSRDNMFRSDNVSIGTTSVLWNENISIIGIGKAVLKGADNPRSTGDGYRTLVLTPQKGRVSYGSDAGKEGRKQKGDWRNIMILMAYVNGFDLQNVTIENSHAWAVSFERTLNAYIADVRFNLPEEQIVNGNKVIVRNRDGIDLRQGCKNFRINNISGNTEDDFIALSSLATEDGIHDIGDINSTMVTPAKWYGTQDDIEQITITNITCQSNTRAVAIRATDSAGIHHVYINGVTAKTKFNNMLIGGKGYGKPSLPGAINNIFAMNIIGDGDALILIESPIADCEFMNGIFSGNNPDIIKYTIDKSTTKNIGEVNLVKVPVR